MSKSFGPSFNVHTFSSVPYSPQDLPAGPHTSQFSWSVAASSSIQSLSPAILPESNGIPSPAPVVPRPRRPLRNKKRTKEELEITLQAFERLSARLAQDHIAVLQPDVDTPFTDHADAARRLLPFHIYQQPRDDLELLKRHKGKQKITNADLQEEIKDTRFALACHERYQNLRNRFRNARIRTATRSAPADQAYVLAQAILEADRVDVSLLSNELKVARTELERLEREKRAPGATATRTVYATAPAMAAAQAQYYRTYPYAYTQAYGAPMPPPTTTTFHVSPPPPTTNPNRPNTAIPVQLPVASLPALHALGIHPVPATSIVEGTDQTPPAVLRGSTANGTMLTLEINVSLLQSAQMSGLAMVLNSLMSRTGAAASPSVPPRGTSDAPPAGNSNTVSGSSNGT